MGCAAAQYVFAQPLVIPEHDATQLPADTALEYLPLNVLSAPPQSLNDVKTAPFVPVQQGVLNFGFTRQPVWVRLTIYNMNAQSRWWLSVGTVRLQSVTLYQQDEQGRWYEKRQGLDYLDEISSHHRDHLFELNITPNHSRTFYIKVESLTAIALPITLWQPLSYIAKHDQGALLQGGLYGLFIGIAIYYLIVSVLLKKSTYWQFSSFLFSFAVTSAAYNGYLQLWWGPFPGQWNIRIILFSIVCTNIGLVAFVRNFLHVRRYAPLMAYGLTTSLIASGVLLVATVVWTDYVTLSRFLSGWSPMNGALVLVAAMWVMLKGYRPARLFLLSMTVVWVTLLLHILFMLGWVAIPFSEQMVLWSLMGVVPLMAASFADQHRLLEAEKEAALEQALELKQQSLEALEDAIAERTQQLDQARQRAEAASEAKTNFLAVMSHELRSPMTAVLGAARLLNRQPLPQTAYELVNTLDSAGDQLLRLIDDVLDLSRAEAGQPILMPAIFNPEQLVSEVYNLMKPVAADRGLELVLMIQGTLPEALWGDASALQRVFNNLVVNATRYAERGTITIGVECQRERARNVVLNCWVEDQGPGISVDQQAIIFQPFEQLDQSHGRQHGGAGLGLSICRRLVEAMSGTLSLKSQPGEGTRFYFSVSLPEVRAVASDNVWQRPSLRILLVEDVAMNREVLTQLLSHEGHDVIAVSGGEQALQQFRLSAPVSDTCHLPAAPLFDVVLLDIQMPGMDGFEVTRQIRALPKALQPRHLLALTASYTQPMRAQCLEAGMDGLVAKPLRLSLLYQTLKSSPLGSSELADIDNAQVPPPSAIWHEYANYLDEDELETFKALQQQTLAERFQWLQEAWSQRDWKQMERNAHDLISMLAGVGAISLSDQALALEQALKASDESLVHSLMVTFLANSQHWM
ncbi:hypothetical protein BFW38_00240 [Terasakiispira papahanaumokuakeensis]|uniref:histidine kinase n=1 Tax=Terasakiispira papahanaumokuakeensis TaxID=197479 RepID=A0A1E2V5E6_9GAMM|nr:hypothetical protein BFW38_00240 [Terasakiispira papahanaumokuakeensis]